MSPVRLLRRIQPAVRYPVDPRALFILGFCVLSAIPLIFFAARPGSLDELMPPWMVFAWGLLLALGSLTTLVGTFIRNINGIIIEQVGSVAAGGAALVYAVAAFMVAGWDAAFGGALILGWSFACLWRWAQLQALILDTQAVVNGLGATDGLSEGGR